MILAETTPYRAAPRVAGEGRIRPAQQQALELATVLVPKAMGLDAKNPDGWAVQLGAYDSVAVVKEKWRTVKKRNDRLGSFAATNHSAQAKGGTHQRQLGHGHVTS